MADKHLQVNPDGTTATRATVLWPWLKAGQEKIIRDIFARDGWTVSELKKQAGSFWKLKTASNIKSWNINLYISSIRDESRQLDEFKMQLGDYYPNGDEPGWITVILGIYVINDGKNPVQYLLSGYKTDGYDFSKNPSLRGTRTYGLQQAFLNGIFKTSLTIIFKPDFIYYYLDNIDIFFGKSVHTHSNNRSLSISNENIRFMPALRTKPFMLLAGISGTGKSRIVRKLAQASVTEDLQRKYDSKSVEGGFSRWELHKPANFEIVQVKPNWHNSMDVVGYFSNIPTPHYEFTPFTDFIGRAWLYKDIPFFLCLDEMNLAPVEEYFAEFLSAIESRTKENGEYETDPIIKPFSNYGEKVCNEMVNHLIGKVDAANAEDNSPEGKLVKRFKSKGLTLPPNLIVMGTVNMDETTYSFSRKVLDRAMSIEMNEVNYDSFITGETENDMKAFDGTIKELLVDRPISATKENITDKVDSTRIIDYLKCINILFDNTPFKLGYRAANEAILYASAAKDFGNDSLESALDEFTLMKILSRIEGDESKLSIDEKDPKIKALNYNSEDVKFKGEGSLDTSGITILSFLHKIIEDKLGKSYTEDSEDMQVQGQPANNADKTVVTDSLDGDADTSALVEPVITPQAQSKKRKSLLKLESMMNQLSREHFVTYWN